MIMAAGRDIVLDQEMTGLPLSGGHRLVEVAAIERRDGVPTGRVFHAYINPERPCAPEAYRCHGLSDAFLAAQPVFAAIAAELRTFIGDDTVIITCRTDARGHTPDIDFLADEMARAGQPPLAPGQWLNVRRWSEAMFGDEGARLNAVLDRYGADRAGREGETGHGALLDAGLLAVILPALERDYETFRRGNAGEIRPSPPGP